MPVIISCTILSDTDGVVTRAVEFQRGAGPSGKSGAREVVRGYGRSWIDFEQEDGRVIRNIISDGAEGGLFLTFSFEMGVGEVEVEVEEKREGLGRVSGVFGLGWGEGGC